MFVRVNELETVNMQRVLRTEVRQSETQAKKFEVLFFGEGKAAVVSYGFDTEAEANTFLKVCITEGVRRDLKEFTVRDGKVVL